MRDAGAMPPPQSAGAAAAPRREGVTRVAPAGAQPRAVADSTRADLDVVFVLDTTGSMSGEIGEAQERLRQLAAALRTARTGQRVRFGVVAFRDRGDDYVTKSSPLSEEIATTETFLDGLAAGGGGDEPESDLEALDV